jgi:hypothetical protein
MYQFVNSILPHLSLVQMIVVFLADQKVMYHLVKTVVLQQNTIEQIFIK